jgi:Ni,Fe-hydrogenase III large subunit
MFSLREDTVLDPFLGTGTTMAAAMATGRNSIGIEVDPNFKDCLRERFRNIVEFSNRLLESRIENHIRFVKERTSARLPVGYLNRTYGFPVMTRQEVELIFDELEEANVEEDFVEVKYREKPPLIRNSCKPSTLVHPFP